VLGNMEPNIQEADLGAKGTYYRVRVGPWASRGEAVQVCERLRAAGGDCIVTR
jgi:cell division protein FtsN